MKPLHLVALPIISLALAACDSTSSAAKNSDTKPVPATASNPNPGTAGGPINSSRNNGFGTIDPMATGTDGRMPTKNY